MRFYLTGAPTPGAHQPLPDRSFGGYIAATPFENATEGNLWGATGRQALLKRVARHRLLALRNETAATVIDLRIWLRPFLDSTSVAVPDPYFDWSLALVLPATDSTGQPYFETIARDVARPSYATFTPDPEEADALTLPELGIGSTVGIWLRQVPKGLPAPALDAELNQLAGPPADIVTERTLALAWT